MTNILLFDDVEVSLLPAGYDAYAGYVDGIYANISQIRARFPSAHILTIAVRSTDVADALDIETGDATIDDAPGWFKRSLASGVTRPCLYISVSDADALVAKMDAAGIPRTAYRLWTAHYAAGQHICGPNTCRLTMHEADATQYTDNAEGRSLDESLCLGDFFTIVVPTPPNGLPTLTQGDTGTEVKTLQERLNIWGDHLTVDASFGPATLAAVKAFQEAHKLTPDGVVGPQTWGALLKNPPVVKFAAPTGLRVVSGIISVSWDEVPDSLGKKPTGYAVIASDAGQEAKKVSVAGTTAVLDGLERNKVYEISVAADGGQVPSGSARITVTA